MKNAILIHGCCSKDEFFSAAFTMSSHNHWFPWMQRQLIERGIDTQTPEMPTPYDPQYEEWKKILDQYSITPETLLIGHSCGAGFLLRWLTETHARAGTVIFVAPWLDPVKKRAFLDFVIDPSLQNRVGKIEVLFSTDETVRGVKKSVEIIRETLPSAQLHTFQNMGHFIFEDMQSKEFPALLALAQESPD